MFFFPGKLATVMTRMVKKKKSQAILTSIWNSSPFYNMWYRGKGLCSHLQYLWLCAVYQPPSTLECMTCWCVDMICIRPYILHFRHLYHVRHLVGIQLETVDHFFHAQFVLIFCSPSSVSISNLKSSCEIEEVTVLWHSVVMSDISFR